MSKACKKFEILILTGGGIGKTTDIRIYPQSYQRVVIPQIQLTFTKKFEL